PRARPTCKSGSPGFFASWSSIDFSPAAGPPAPNNLAGTSSSPGLATSDSGFVSASFGRSFSGTRSGNKRFSDSGTAAVALAVTVGSLDAAAGTGSGTGTGFSRVAQPSAPPVAAINTASAVTYGQYFLGGLAGIGSGSLIVSGAASASARRDARSTNASSAGSSGAYARPRSAIFIAASRSPR